MALASITSQTEQLNVQQSIIEAGGTYENHYWVSGTDLQTRYEWMWMASGQSVEAYTNWSMGEPNNRDGEESCIEMYVSTRSWNDRNCDVENFFVCEYFVDEEPRGV